MEAKKSNVIGLGAAFVLGMLILGGSLVLMASFLDLNTPFLSLLFKEA